MKELPSQEILHSLLRYDEETGKLFWRPRPASMFSVVNRSQEHSAKIWNTKNAGKEAFTGLSAKGYLVGAIFGQIVYAHRVIWKMVYGTEPDQIDHIDGNKTLNKLFNMRSVDGGENHRNTKRPRNNTTGVIGVHAFRDSGRFVASIKHEGKSVHLGYFDTVAEAAVVRKAAERDYGYHPNHGRG